MSTAERLFNAFFHRRLPAAAVPATKLCGGATQPCSTKQHHNPKGETTFILCDVEAAKTREKPPKRIVQTRGWGGELVQIRARPTLRDKRENKRAIIFVEGNFKLHYFVQAVLFSDSFPSALCTFALGCVSPIEPTYDNVEIALVNKQHVRTLYQPTWSSWFGESQQQAKEKRERKKK